MLAMLPTLLYAQNSWVNIELLTDTYPGETTWKITPPGGTPVLASNDTGMLPNTVYTQFLAVGGQIVVEIEDSYGDGLDATAWGGTIGHFLISNSCQDTILFVEGNFGSFYTDTLTIAPCAPPSIGCTDPLASNYDPNALISNDSCVYPVTFVLDMNYYNGQFTTPEVNGEFNGWCGSSCNPMNDPDGDNVWEVTIDIAPGQYLWKYALDNWTEQELPQLGPNSACFLPDGFGFINRTLVVGPAPQTLPLVCWESCLPCGAILGCMDSLSENYNPWANIDDGSCQTGPQCDSGETYIEIEFTPDNYPSESGFKVFGDNGLILEILPGALAGSTPGVPIPFYACVDTGELYDVIIEDTYGDGVCGTCFGGTVNGNLEIFGCDGSLIFSLQDTVPDGNFNYLFTTPQFEPPVCTSGPTLDSGCTDPFYVEYDSEAQVDDGTCATSRVVGCTDATAFNYQPNANTSEHMTGFYTLEIFDGASDGWGGTWLGLKQGDWISPQYQIGPNDGNSITFPVQLNIYEPIYAYVFTTPQSITSINQVAFELTGPEGDTILDVNYWDALPFPYIFDVDTPDFGDVCVPVILGCTDSTSFNWIIPTGDPLVDVNTDDGSCIPVIPGCTNPLAFNYNPAANVDDSSCVATVYGCTDTAAFNYNPNANVSDGNCVYLGCTDATACNYDSTANVDNGGCIYAVQYYDCNGDCITDTDGDGVCDELEIPGCMDPLSLNFNPNATDPDSSCIPIVYGCTDSTSFNYDTLANVDDGTCIPIVLGCTDPTSFNYNSNANTDDGSCIPIIYGCTDPTSYNYDSTANTDNGSCVPYIYGCTDSTMFNYDPLANTDNGSCIPIVLGCTDPVSFTYNPLANTNDNTCCYVGGCTDSTSLNYDPDACYDDGTCVTIVPGCTDVAAYNYEPTANVDDGSCNYDAGCYGGPGVPYWLNDECYAWVIDVDSYCCTDNWDSSCETMYDYCQNGWPVNVEEFTRENQVAIWPNPTEDIVNIKCFGKFTVQIYDNNGRQLTEILEPTQLDFSDYPAGMYQLKIIIGDLVINKKVIKQ